MRIISGKLRGRRLHTPADDKIRPTTDKVKEAVFSMIAPYIGDSVVIDLFAGTGNLGLEAISRGAQRAYFVDSSSKSCKLIRQNIDQCKVQDQAVLLFSDYSSALERIPEKADIIFIDPPYQSGFLESCLDKIQQYGILAEEGIVVVEHGFREELPSEVGALNKIKEKEYGKIKISIYELPDQTQES